MARMTREMSLVLVGAGILTAGYFLYPEDDLEAKQKEQVEQQLAGNNNGNNNNSHRRYGGGFIFIHTGAWGGGGMASSRPAALGGSVKTGGFSSIGRSSVSS